MSKPRLAIKRTINPAVKTRNATVNDKNLIRKDHGGPLTNSECPADTDRSY